MIKTISGEGHEDYEIWTCGTCGYQISMNGVGCDVCECPECMRRGYDELEAEENKMKSSDDEIDYKEREFIDSATGETYTGEDFYNTNPDECIWEINEYELTKDLKVGEEAHTRIISTFYDRELHISDDISIKRMR